MTSATWPATRDPKSVAILLSEGSSLTARQTLSALGPLGYKIDLCDSNRLCVGRYSQFVRRCYPCPPMSQDPVGYLEAICDRLDRGRYDALLPVHEQAFLFARVQNRLGRRAGLALSPFGSFAALQSKASFSRLMTQLGLPQPATRLAHSRSELAALDDYPYYVKHPYSTAGQGVWLVRSQPERSAAMDALGEGDAWSAGIVVQAVAPGVLSQAQAVFENGTLVALHCTTQRAVGVGGSQSARLSVDHPVVQRHLALLGDHLCWHGALTIDYLWAPDRGEPRYIEANPRIVEPMNGVLSGVNLPEVLVRLSLGESFTQGAIRKGRIGTKSHSLMAMAMGVGASGGSRGDLLRLVAQAIASRGAFAGSREDLTPIGLDPLSALPLAACLSMLLCDPANAHVLAGQAVSNYALSAGAVQRILDLRDDAEETGERWSA